MATLNEVLEKPGLRKPDNEFRFDSGCFTAGKRKQFAAEQQAIVKVFRFEGESDPRYVHYIYH